MGRARDGLAATSLAMPAVYREKLTESEKKIERGGETIANKFERGRASQSVSPFEK